MIFKKKLILIGAGGHASSCIDVIEQEGRFKIAGIVGFPQEKGLNRFGYEVIGSDEDLTLLGRKFEYALIAVGQIKSPKSRINLYNNAKAAGFKFPNIVSPYAYVSAHSNLGEGNIVMHGALINAGVIIGNNCIINSHSLVEHDVKIGSHVHISTGAIINGGVSIGNNTFIGSQCVAREGICIGENCIVGMGTNVLFNLQNNAVFTGQ
jgi:sugar O-acyltransferase (sialic acid O-acetyltransferase NeuD family)